MAAPTSAPPVPNLTLLHGALLMGLVVVAGVAAFLLFGRTGPLLAADSGTATIGFVMAAVSLGVTAMAVAFLRPRLPPRPSGQSAGDYWAIPGHARSALLLWVALEQGGFIGLVGWLLTGSLAAALAGLVAVAALVMFPPARLAGP